MIDKSDSSSSAPSAARDAYRGILWLILLVGAALRIYLLFSTHATEEDFYITLRYAENIAAGHGFVYNAGQHVLGTTTPLYTLLLAAFARIGLDPTLCGKLVGICADLLAGLFTYRFGRTIGRPVAGLAAVILLSFAPTNLTWSVNGMEVGIVAAVAIGAWAAWAEKRELIAWFCVALLVLLRIDGVALAAVMFCATMFRDRRLPWRGVCLCSAILAPWLLFALVYFGSAIPLSLGAKLKVYGRMIPGQFPQLRPFFTLMLHNPIGVAVAFGCLCFITCGYKRWQRLRRGTDSQHPEVLLAAPLAWIGIYYASMALSHVFLFGWYFVPPTPIYYLAGMVGLSLVADRMGIREADLDVKRVRSAAVTIALVIVCTTTPRVDRNLLSSQLLEEDLRIPIGIWLRDNSRPQDTLMLEPIGYIGYYSRLTIIDVIGLVSPEVLQGYDSNIPCPEHDLWQRLRPDWFLLRAGELNSLVAYENSLPENQRLESAYSEAKSWKAPDSDSEKPAFILFRKRIR